MACILNYPDNIEATSTIDDDVVKARIQSVFNYVCETVSVRHWNNNGMETNKK